MRKFIISDRFTTADIGLDLESDSLDGLFMAAAEGMFAIILGAAPAGPKSLQKNIILQEATPEQLLVDWLSELLYLFDTDGLIACGYDLKVVSRDEAYVLRGNVDFRIYDREKDIAEHEIKAATYYKLKVERAGGIFRCHVVFDL